VVTLVNSGQNDLQHEAQPSLEAKPYKILLVSGAIPPVYAGAGFQWYRYARRLEQRGQLAFLLCLALVDKGCEGFQAQVAEQKIVRMPPCSLGLTVRADSVPKIATKLWWMFSLFARVGWLLFRCRKDYEVVHVTSCGPLCAFSLLWARMLGKVAIYETSLPQSDDLLTLMQTARVRHWMIMRSHACLAISPQLYDLCRRGGADEQSLHLVANPRDTDIFHPVDGTTKAMLQKKLGLPENGPIILFVGGILERKGADLLPAIFRGVLKAFPSACLLLVGPEAPLADLTTSTRLPADFIRSELRDCLASGQLIFTGNVYNVHEYMQASDVFLFPSRNEGLPNAPIEAMACGVPCVVRDIEGVSSAYIEHGVDGVIVQGENPADYAEAIIRLLSNEAEYRAMSSKARKKVLFTWSAEVADQHYRLIYEKYLV
jgi:glycosyltransferase involved in cell wall biosynthesis